LAAEEPSRTPAWRRWFFGIVLIAALVGAVLHWGEIERFGQMLRQARPAWLGLAVGLQTSTYVCVAGGWWAVLRRAGTPQPLTRLTRIAVTKLFADQALPTAGMGGNVLLVDQLTRLGASQGGAVAALILSMIGFYAAYSVFAIAMLVLLWWHHHATPVMAGLVSAFLVVAVAIPALALWLRRRGKAPLPAWLEKMHAIRSLLDTVAQAPGELLADRMLLAQVTLCNALVFLADAATLQACLHALGQAAGFGTSFMAAMMAAIVVTLGPLPLGLGTFEATCVATLRLLGVPFEAAFTATILMRVLTLWLPLLPGLFLLRGALTQAGDQHAQAS
jgi:uncharacterized protein (TIRG00374 family)